MIRELKTFLAVVHHGTFARAARQIGLTQSAVSAQIQRLEEDLGFVLFDRTGRSAVLNDAGRRTVGLATELLAAYARLGQQAGPAGDAGSTGLLRVGAIASAQASVLVEAVGRFRRQRPGWQLRLVPGVSLNLLAQLDAGELDLAVMIKPPFALPAEIRWQTLLQEPFVLLAPRRLAAQGWRALLRSQPFIRYDRGSFGGRQVERFLKRQRIAVNEAVELDELQGIVGLVAGGVGVALLPRAASLRLPRTLAGLDLGEDGFTREIGVAWRAQRPAQAAVDNLVGCLVGCLVDGLVDGLHAPADPAASAFQP